VTGDFSRHNLCVTKHVKSSVANGVTDGWWPVTGNFSRHNLCVTHLTKSPKVDLSAARSANASKHTPRKRAWVTTLRRFSGVTHGSLKRREHGR
jgi:hypothetical protein